MSKKYTTFEEQMARLQDIITELESDNLSLERNVSLYKEGQTLARSCKQLLEKARNEILLCEQDTMVPFGSAATDFSPTPDEK